MALHYLIMDISSLSVAHAQFGVSALAFFLFPVLAVALAWFLAFLRWREYRGGNQGWMSVYLFWARVFSIVLVLAVLTALPLLLQFGVTWPGLMPRVGSIASPLLAAGLVGLLLLKFCGLRLMLHRRELVSPRLHLLSVIWVALCLTLLLFCLVVYQAWTHAPVGVTLVDGRYRVDDWWQILFNPLLAVYLPWLVLAGLAALSFLVMAVLSLKMQRKPQDDGLHLVFRSAVVLTLVSTTLLLPVSLFAGTQLQQWQPAKAAAVAGYWQTGTEPRVALLAWPNQEALQNDFAWVVNGGGGYWLKKQPDGTVEGLDKYGGMLPPVALVFWSARVLLVLLIVMPLIAWRVWAVGGWRRFDVARLTPARLKMLRHAGWLGLAALAAGLLVMEAGKLPYAVQGTVTYFELLEGGLYESGDLGMLLCFVALAIGTWWFFYIWLRRAAVQHIDVFEPVPLLVTATPVIDTVLSEPDETVVVEPDPSVATTVADEIAGGQSGTDVEADRSQA